VSFIFSSVTKYFNKFQRQYLFLIHVFKTKCAALIKLSLASFHLRFILLLPS